jgi:PAS domain S-box-containing protein
MNSIYQDNDRHYRAIFEHAAVGMCQSTPDGRFVRVNKALCDMVGHSADELLTLNVADITHPDDLPLNLDHITTTLAGEQDHYTAEKRCLHKSGRIIWVEMAMSLVRSDDGEAEFFIGIMSDITGKVLVKRALHASQAQLSNSQRLAHLGSWELELETDLLTWSAETFAIFETTPGEFSSTYEAFLNRVHPEDRSRVDEIFDASVASGRPYDVNHRLLLPDGRVKWVHERGETLYENGTPVRTVGAVQDITGRVAFENSLRAANKLVEAVLDTTPVSIAYLDTDMNFVRVNRPYAAADGKEPEYFVGRNHFGLYPNEENEAIFREVVRTGEAYSVQAKPFEYEHNPERGVTHWDWAVMPVKSEYGEVTGLVLSLLNVTDRVKAIEAAHESERQLRRLNDELETHVAERTSALKERELLLREAQRIAHLGHWTVNVRTGELSWSDEIYRIFGQEPQAFEPSQDRFFEMVHPDDRDTVWRAQDEAFTQDKVFSVDHRIVLEDGMVRWVHEEAETIKGPDGAPLQLAGTVQDITERKHIEQALELARDEAERASRAKSQFLSRMSHELRTPMNAILGFAQILALEELAPGQQDYVREISQAGGHLLQLIEELLDLSRIEAGKYTVVVEPIDAGLVIAEASGIVQPLMTQKQVVLHNACENRSLPVLADAMRLRQILVNLLSNATKYNRVGGRITIACMLVGTDRLRIAVSDTGPGIAPEHRERVFVPFDRLGAEFTGVEGTGVGLAISRQVAELMGGVLDYESVPGDGATFWVVLQRTPGGGTDIPGDPLSDASLTEISGRTVLYVEDNPANLRVVEALFRRHTNVKLLSATNGAALQAGFDPAGHPSPGHGRLRGTEGTTTRSRDRAHSGGGTFRRCHAARYRARPRRRIPQLPDQTYSGRRPAENHRRDTRINRRYSPTDCRRAPSFDPY